jgi:hypothetical protein
MTKFDTLYKQIINEELDKGWESEVFGKGLSSVVQSGEGTEESPFIPAIWTDLHLLAGILRDYSKDKNKTYYYEFNNQMYKATGENKLIKVDNKRFEAPAVGQDHPRVRPKLEPAQPAPQHASSKPKPAQSVPRHVRDAQRRKLDKELDRNFNVDLENF